MTLPEWVKQMQKSKTYNYMDKDVSRLVDALSIALEALQFIDSPKNIDLNVYNRACFQITASYALKRIEEL
jgi:hypothetical protein